MTPFEQYCAFVLAILLVIAGALYAAVLVHRMGPRVARWAGLE